MRPDVMELVVIDIQGAALRKAQFAGVQLGALVDLGADLAVHQDVFGQQETHVREIQVCM
ncbi:hypothetical protein DPMN_182165 [Dreissena polymorpha]|uniref:Uncharacterized protein n=1 Tax=Dreissena polymorpha TaxID=45954 RepID=A0A9D4DF33_DREPO|nr:hypothetical protein DPMN_182165 [Dreissena polymorpha]